MPNLQAIDISQWEQVIRQIGKDLQSGKIKPGDLNKTMIQETYNELNGGMKSGYGKDWANVNGKESKMPNPRILKMQQNIYKFSAAKTATAIRDLNERLYQDGKLLELDAFKKEIEALNLQYNKNWLAAEYNTARQSGIMAQKWEAIKANEKLFPNLKYRTQGDDKVRPEHAQLDGIIRPINDPFWKKYYPPNGWRCRCDVVQTAENATKNIPDHFPDIKPEFELNIGQSGQIYKDGGVDQHNYFALAKEYPNWRNRFEQSKLNAAFENFDTPNGKKVAVSIYAHDIDLAKNFTAASFIKEQLKDKVSIRPHIELDGWRNPELMINDKVADRYEGDIAEGFKAKRKQIKSFIKKFNDTYRGDKIAEEYSLVFDISGATFKYDIARKINGEFKTGRKMSEVYLINGTKVVKITRSNSYSEIKAIVAKIAKEG